MNIRDAQRPVDARVPAEARGEAPVRVFSTDIMAFNGSVAMVPARGDAFTAAFRVAWISRYIIDQRLEPPASSSAPVLWRSGALAPRERTQRDDNCLFEDSEN